MLLAKIDETDDWIDCLLEDASLDFGLMPVVARKSENGIENCSVKLATVFCRK